MIIYLYGLSKPVKNNSNSLLAQLPRLIPSHIVESTIKGYKTNYWAKRLFSPKQLMVMRVELLSSAIEISPV